MHNAADLIINFVHLKLKVQVVFIVAMLGSLAHDTGV